MKFILFSFSEDCSLKQWSVCYLIAYHLLKQALDAKRSDTIIYSTQIFVHCIAMYDKIQERLDKDKQTKGHYETLMKSSKETRQTLKIYYSKWDIYLESILEVKFDTITVLQKQSLQYNWLK